MDRLILSFAISFFFCTALAAKGDPADWAKTYPQCDVKNNPRQSPIFIWDAYVDYNDTLEDLQFINYGVPSGQGVKYTLLNTGFTAKINFEGTNMLTNESRYGLYKAAQMHFHWGNPDRNTGAEHIFNGKQYPAELHIVHFNEELYANLSNAANKPDGLLVLGIIIEMEEDKDYVNKNYEPITQLIKHILYKGQTYNMPPISLETLLPKEASSKYYTYPGGLTTPPCYGSVRWIVFKNHVKLSKDQLHDFYEMHSGNATDSKIIDYFRPIQPLGNRKVEKSFNVFNSAESAWNFGLITFFLLLITSFIFK